MSKQELSTKKVSNVILKLFNKHRGDFKDICKSKQESLHSVS